MTILTEQALNFARQSISAFYDTDFFPKPFEFEAIWNSWDDVVKELTSRNTSKIMVSPPRSAPARKPRGGYRIVHQLDPVDALIYTALVYQVAGDIENARMPTDAMVACAYRIEIDDAGGFFSAGSGYDTFREQSQLLAETNEFVLLTDITDFYNQIYLHRINNAIEHANAQLKGLADDIEQFLLALNGKTSQGVPVGPPASIIMAEAVLIDVDQFIANQGLQHTRYVDDFRIYSPDRNVLDLALQRLTQYLYEAHRLTLSSEKTRIVPAKDFVEKELNNPYELEKFEVFEEIEVLNPYTNEREEQLVVSIDRDATRKVVMEALEGLVKRTPLDLGFARALIRQAKAAELVEPAALILDNFELFMPVANTIFVYLEEITDDAFIREFEPRFVELASSRAAQNVVVRTWCEWYLTSHREVLRNPNLKAFLYQSPSVVTQARVAVNDNNLAWIREKKAQIQNLGSWDRRAILYASQILPSDEKRHWVKQVMLGSPVPLDRWVCKWILDMDELELF